FFVLEDDAIALLVPGADEDGGDHADAHAADSGHVTAPGISRCRHIVHDGGRLGERFEGHVGQKVATSAFAGDGALLEAGARFDDSASFIGDTNALAGGIVHAPGQIGVDLAAVVCVNSGQAGAGCLFGTFQAVFAHLRGDVHVGFLGEVTFFLDDSALF